MACTCHRPDRPGKSSTLAAILDRMNEEKAYHILTIEDPSSFCIVIRKRPSISANCIPITPTFALALRAALRQAPKVILVGEMRDRETIEIALEASETGHLVMSTLHTIDAAKTVERIVGVFPMTDQHAIRSRLSKAFRFIVSQRLLPKKDGKGRIAAVEILKSTMRTREYVEKGESEGKSLLDAMRDGSTEGMQHFDGEIDKLIREGIVAFEPGSLYSSNAGNFAPGNGGLQRVSSSHDSFADELVNFLRRNAACLLCCRRAWRRGATCLRSRPFSTYSRVRIVISKSPRRRCAPCPSFLGKEAFAKQ